MKLPRIFRRSTTISGKLTRRITLTVFLIMTAISALLVGLIWIVGTFLVGAFYSSTFNVTEQKMNGMFTAIEVAIDNNVDDVEECLDHPDKLFTVAERIVKQNPNIIGASIAFEPGYYAQKGRQFAPYAYRDSTGIKTKQLGSASYDYHHMSWYEDVKKSGKEGWSRPYIDKGGGEQAMITYSKPLFDKRGKMYAVMTADIAMKWIEDMRALVDSINNEEINLSDEAVGHSYCIFTDSMGLVIAHPEQKHVLKSSVFDLFSKKKSAESDSFRRDLRRGEKSFTAKAIDEKIYIIYFGPIEFTQWRMVIVIPLKELATPMNWFAVIYIIFISIALIIVMLVSYITIRLTTKPLRKFVESANEIAKGNFEADLPVIKTRDEMLQLRNSFELMQVSLINQIEQTKLVNAEKGRIEGELHIARNIQMSMLPKVFPPYPDRTDIDIYAELNPAKEVGGDLYDFYIRDEKLFFCIGDVSGKGVPAALVMAVTKSLFRTVTAHESHPARIANTINEVMLQGNDSNMFVTLFVGVLDLPTGRMRYCNAGHCAPILVGSGAGPLPVISNLPTGIMSDFRFKAQEVLIDPGTTIFLYTDGLTEAENIRKELFDDERLLQRCNDIYNSQPQAVTPKEFIRIISETVHDFVQDAEQSDDLTMLAIKYTKKQEDNWLQRSLSLPNDIEQIPRLSEFIDSACEEAHIDMSTTMSINLAIEEAVVNVMTYAYPEGTMGEVNIEVFANDRRVKFVISDTGTPFDPTAQGEVDTTLSAEERPIGGLGIHLVRQIMDTVNYEYVDGKNTLTLRKMLPGADGSQDNE